ncbi:hypothetical protein IIA28_06170 [candidate division KSB1 bacterium]|nr:hypothetical protein [candidate division KSB1 bacterium]
MPGTACPIRYDTTLLEIGSPPHKCNNIQRQERSWTYAIRFPRFKDKTFQTFDVAKALNVANQPRGFMRRLD